MESSDKQLILSLIKSNKLLEKLYNEHLKLEEILESLGNKRFLTKDEERDYRNLKIKKLHGVDKMMKLIKEV